MTEHRSQHSHRLPQAVTELALRLGADPAAKFESVSFSQTGSMRPNLKSRLWLPFTARQTMSVRTCQFTWKARFRPLGYLAVTDALERGGGRLDVTAFGFIPLVRTKPGAALLRGELIRYLAELPLAPDAILHNHHLDWREIDAATLAVSAGTGETACEVVFSLGAEGRIRSAFCADRPASGEPPFTSMPWRGVFVADERQHEGRWIPSAAQVGWEIDGREEFYWKGEIRDWRTIHES